MHASLVFIALDFELCVRPIPNHLPDETSSLFSKEKLLGVSLLQIRPVADVPPLLFVVFTRFDAVSLSFVYIFFFLFLLNVSWQIVFFFSQDFFKQTLSQQLRIQLFIS